VVQCENPARHRWGKAPPDYRGLRKTWTARDMAYKKRDKFVLKDVIQSSVPALGISAAAGAALGASPAPAAAADAKAESGCTLQAVGRGPASRLSLAGLLLAALASIGLPWRRARAQPLSNG
jgi:hypothetical protein